MKEKIILFIDDDHIDRMAFERFASKKGFPFTYDIAASLEEARRFLAEKKYSLVVADYFLGDGSAAELLEDIIDIPIIIVTGSVDIEVAVESMKSGAYDFINKDSEGNYLKTLPVSIFNALKRKEMEDELKMHRRNLEEANRRMKKEIDEKNYFCKDLEEKARELESFVHTVSHDLKAPLVVLGGYSSLIMKQYSEILDEEGRGYLELLSANVRHMEQLIRDLLELSRIGKVVNSREEVDVEGILKQMKEGLRIQLEEKNISFHIHTPLPRPMGDMLQMKQVFDNLISNAIKFTGPQKAPVIEIGAKDYDDDFFLFYVRDNGIGIDNEHHERIFKEFHRLKEIESDGTGIGLAIVKKVVEGHNGKVWVKSRPGEGSTFFFTLPRGRKIDGTAESEEENRNEQEEGK